MLEIIVVIAIVLVVLIAAIVIWAAMQPNDFRIERSASIRAAPDKIYPFINDLHAWGAWSAYETKDPAMQRTFSGAPNGKGAVYEWDGNNNVGRGRMEIVDASPPSRVTIKLDFIKPFEGHNTAEFTLAPAGEATNVTWSMSGPRPFIGKILCMFINMDNMIGKDFAAGLANLKSVAEK